MLRTRLALLGTVSLLLAFLQAAHADTADVALVLAVDTSESIDAGEYRLQHEGIARAFENPRVIDAIISGRHGAIDVLVLEWSGRHRQTIIVDWTQIKDRPTASAFAAEVRAGKHNSDGLTVIGDALMASAATFKTAANKPDRRVIDVSGDGMANIGPPPAAIRDALAAEDITINGLAILSSEPWLDAYDDDNVIGGDGAFPIEVKNLFSFTIAIPQKLLAEISARSAATRLVRIQMQ